MNNISHLKRRDFVKSLAAASILSSTGAFQALGSSHKVAELEMWTEMATVPWQGAMDEIVESFNKNYKNINVTHTGFTGPALIQPLHLDQGLGFRDGALFEGNAGPNTHLRCISSNTVS